MAPGSGCLWLIRFRDVQVCPVAVCSLMEGNNVGSSGKVHDNRVIGSVRCIVFGELRAQSPGLHSDHGIELRIEVVGATEDLCRNLILLDWSSGMIQGVLRQ